MASRAAGESVSTTLHGLYSNSEGINLRNILVCKKPDGILRIDLTSFVLMGKLGKSLSQICPEVLVVGSMRPPGAAS